MVRTPSAFAIVTDRTSPNAVGVSVSVLTVIAQVKISMSAPGIIRENNAS